MNKRAVLFIGIVGIFCTLLLTGCAAPYIVMKSQPITAENAYILEQKFSKGQRIFYGIALPKNFKDDVIRVQIVKQDPKVPYFGYKIVWAQNRTVDKTKNYYTDYVTINAAGYYFMQVFELRRTDKCLARYDFWINDND